jgi:hypothetical protein
VRRGSLLEGRLADLHQPLLSLQNGYKPESKIVARAAASARTYHNGLKLAKLVQRGAGAPVKTTWPPARDRVSGGEFGSRAHTGILLSKEEGLRVI